MAFFPELYSPYTLLRILLRLAKSPDDLVTMNLCCRSWFELSKTWPGLHAWGIILGQIERADFSALVQ
jgi:hypothetical protein